MRLHLVVALAAGIALTAAAPAAAQVKLAAASDCPTNPNCIPGLAATYHLVPPFLALTTADSGVEALDDGIAQVAVVFSSNPELARPDLLPLTDDRHMIRPDHIVPVVRDTVLRTYGRDLRTRLNEASALLSEGALRNLNEGVIDGRLAEAVGGEFADANDLAIPGRKVHRRAGPLVTIGYQDFAEDETLAYLYAETLRGGGYRVRVRSVGGLRAQALQALRSGRISLYPGYADSLREFLHGKTLAGALRPLHATALRLAPATDHDVYTMKAATAAALGVHSLSDLARYWPAT